MTANAQPPAPDTSTEAVERLIKSSNKWLCPCPKCSEYRYVSGLLRALAAERDEKDKQIAEQDDWLRTLKTQLNVCMVIARDGCDEPPAQPGSVVDCEAYRAVMKLRQDYAVMKLCQDFAAALKRAEEQAARIKELEGDNHKLFNRLSDYVQCCADIKLSHPHLIPDELVRIVDGVPALRRGEK